MRECNLRMFDTFGKSDKDGKSGSDSETFNNWFNVILDDSNWNKYKIEERYGKRDDPQDPLHAFC
jgi:hypothetical protein